jgi:hypothetical protein
MLHAVQFTVRRATAAEAPDLAALRYDVRGHLAAINE